MKRVCVVALIAAALCVMAVGTAYSEAGRTVSYSGKVTAVDARGKALVMDVGQKGETMTVGVVVEPATKLTVKGKQVPVLNLVRDIKPGDTVTVKYLKSDDCYARQIIKK